MLEDGGNVVVLCDKNMGMSILDLEIMRKADSELMRQMGALEVSREKIEIINGVFEQIEGFEDSMIEEERKYIDFVYKDRNVKNCLIEIPFLRSTHKIHKMTDEMIENKDIENLKFRPIIDARMWATRGYSELVMKMLKKLNICILEKCCGLLRKSQPKSGWEFSKKIQEVMMNERYVVLGNADIQEAYTNVTESMICEAIITLNRRFSIYSQWKCGLLLKMIKLVMRNNYVETSVGLYLFKPVLPMGYKISGEALNTVLLLSEIERFDSCGISELKNYPLDFVDISVKKESLMTRGVKDYNRYVDDIFTMVCGNDIETIMEGILGISYMFPVELVVTMELNIWRSKFLDVMFWRDVESDMMSTVVHQKSFAPVGHVKAKSNHPKKYKLQSMMGELLRNRRISSDEEIINQIDEHIQAMFVSIGYSRLQMYSRMKKYTDKIISNYTDYMTKMNDEVEEKKYMYGGGIEYTNMFDCYNWACEIIGATKLKGEPMLVQVPGRRLKNKVYTKRRYLRRQQSQVLHYKGK